MTRKFTPPTTPVPAEYKDGYGSKCVILAQDPSGGFVGYVVLSSGKWHSREWDATGRFGINSADPDLHDIPHATSTWQNVFCNGYVGTLHPTRADADRGTYIRPKGSYTRIAVLRRDTIDGVTTPNLEGV